MYHGLAGLILHCFQQNDKLVLYYLNPEMRAAALTRFQPAGSERGYVDEASKRSGFD
jgi:hypothetical protein